MRGLTSSVRKSSRGFAHWAILGSNGAARWRAPNEISVSGRGRRLFVPPALNGPGLAAIFRGAGTSVILCSEVTGALVANERSGGAPGVRDKRMSERARSAEVRDGAAIG